MNRRVTRKSRKHLLNLILFVSALCLVIYLNSNSSTDGRFAWTKVRYVATSKPPQEGGGKCPGLSESEKPALVVSRIEADDARWLSSLEKKYHICAYLNDVTPNSGTDSRMQIPVPANRGHEAMAYLTFIIDNYANLPTAGAVFIHGSRWAWHNDSPDYDNLALLSALNTSSALEPTGYHNLRCDWSAGTCAGGSSPDIKPLASLETKMSARLEPWNKRAVSDALIPSAFAELFGEKEAEGRVLLSSTEFLRAQCCAQFVVAQERIWQHSREEYIALRQWLLDPDGAPRDDKISGRVLSYLWHILFLPYSGRSNVMDASLKAIDLESLNARACPSAKDCYCRLYGRCHLEDCSSPGRCEGQYTLPKDWKLPDDWAATHS